MKLIFDKIINYTLLNFVALDSATSVQNLNFSLLDKILKNKACEVLDDIFYGFEEILCILVKLGSLMKISNKTDLPLSSR